MKKAELLFKAAPLPFQGQKRNFVKEFRATLSEFREKEDIHTIVDLFGGSGLLSHVAKRECPDCTVIYNDYDDFHVRLANISHTNQLLEQIREVLPNYARNEKINEPYRTQILKLVADAQTNGYVDYITLSASLLFSGRYATNQKEFETETFYNVVRRSDYEISGYLDGLIIVKSDYMELFNRYKDQKGVLFVVDPPYLSTDTKTYKSDNYWRLKDYLDVLKVLTVDKYIFFTSNKSSLIELCEWFTENPDIKNPFMQARIKTYQQHLNYTAKYTDIMLFRSDNIRK